MRMFRALLVTLVLGPMLPATPGLAADLPAIKARGQMIAATSGNLPPVTFLNDKNELTGYDIEVGRFIANHLGVKLLELLRREAPALRRRSGDLYTRGAFVRLVASATTLATELRHRAR
jgi:ABC-type amino acid transport substrate-binding protein